MSRLVHLENFNCWRLLTFSDTPRSFFFDYTLEPWDKLDVAALMEWEMGLTF